MACTVCYYLRCHFTGLISVLRIFEAMSLDVFETRLPGPQEVYD